ncbi:hypothetical protein BAE44_0010793, partial [Dichanthelium oligosanthes]
LGCRSSFLELALPKVCRKAAASSTTGIAAAIATPDEVGGYAECEEYTCIISRGANPRMMHILAGETLEVRTEGSEVAGGGCKKAIFSIEPFSDWQPSTSAPAQIGAYQCWMQIDPALIGAY